MRLLMKFGGTSVADAESVGRTVAIIGRHHVAGDEVAVVISAQRGVTDQLITIAGEVASGTSTDGIDPLIQSLRLRHVRVLDAVAPDFAEDAATVIEERLDALRNILQAVYNLRELTPRSRDYIITFGERLNAPVVAAALRQKGMNAPVLDGGEAGILTTDHHGEAIALPESEEMISGRIVPMLSRGVPVIMGFMGYTREGIVTTLGRSGSDYSAVLIGCGIDADEIWIWTDVDGIMTTDPRLVPSARVLQSVSYLEIMELSFFGAKVMHPRSIEPAMRKGTPVLVKNTFNPSFEGTRIVRHAEKDRRVVKALTYIGNVATVAICGAQMIGRPGVARAIFSALADHEINVMMISQGSSEANISLVIEESQVGCAVEALQPLVSQGVVREVTANRDVAAVAAVGAGMAGAKGTGGRIFSALGRGGINVMMISQGSSEANISFVVSQEDGPKAVQTLHEEYRLSEESDD